MEVPNLIKFLVQPGDKVRVVRRVDEWAFSEFGTSQTIWVPRMDRTIGTLVTVVRVETEELEAVDSSGGTWLYPYEALEWVSSG